MLKITMFDMHGNEEVIRDINNGEVIPINPIPDRGEVRLVACNDTAKRISDVHLGNTPFCKTGATVYRGEMAEFVYLNLRGKTL